MPLKRLVSALLFLFLTACSSTTVNSRLALEASQSATLKFGEVVVSSSLQPLPVDVVDRLKTAVAERLSKLPQGTTPVRVHLTITAFRVATAGDRFMTGVFAGANEMTVSVKLDDGQGRPIADFDVMRRATPGAYGAFSDQKTATIEAAADGVVEALADKKQK